MSNKSTDKSTLVPKSGEWDVNDPSANGYSMIFNKIKDEKRDGKIQSYQRIQHPMSKNVKLLLEIKYLIQ